jgi:hypothetical protein
VKPLHLKLGAAGLAAVAVVGVTLIATSRGPGGSGVHAALLEPLGQAYAKDYGIPFSKVDTTVAATLDGANRAQWTQKLGAALAVGYNPGEKPYAAIPFDRVAEGSKIRMSRDRTPQQVVAEKVAAGGTVVEVTWTFGSAPPVKSYTILSPQGRPLFDTLISMPVIVGPVFHARHF